MPSDDNLTDAERLEFKYQERFDAKLAELRAAEEGLRLAIERVHIVTKDLGQVVKDARDSVKRLSQIELQRHLAKEAQRMADHVREDMKRARS